MKHTEKYFLAVLAARQGISLAEFVTNVQEAIDAAWNNPEGAEFRAKLFPEGKPDPEMFIQRIAVLGSQKGGQL